jgi:hypothetical protein
VIDNPNLCGSGSCKKENNTVVPNLCGSGSCKKNNIVVPIVASISGLLILSLIVAAILLRRFRRRKQQDNMTTGEALNYKIHIDRHYQGKKFYLDKLDHSHYDLCRCDGRY